jgi:hypothetical protein
MQVGHSEGIMGPLMLPLGATLLVGAPALIALDPIRLPAQVRSQELKHWISATGLDTVTLLLAAVLLVQAALGVVFATRAQLRRELVRYGIGFRVRTLLIANLHDA